MFKLIILSLLFFNISFLNASEVGGNEADKPITQESIPSKIEININSFYIPDINLIKSSTGQGETINKNGLGITKADCTDIKFELTSLGLGIGGTWGKGALTIAASHGERTRGLVVPSRRRSVVLSESEC